MPPASPDEGSNGEERPVPDVSPRQAVRRSLITGTAIVLPLAVTLLILNFVLGSISDQLNPLTNAIQDSTFVAPDTQALLIEAVTVAALLVVILVIGFAVEYSQRGEQLGDVFDDLMAAIPGIGSVYTSFNEMSEIMLDSDTDSFQEVKLVEYPGKGSYTVAFKTADTPGVIETDTGHEDMVTLFMPMAPNPVMGGFVIHVSTDRVVDVDLTVEQGIRSIVTSGVAIGGEETPELRGLSESEMRELGHIERIDQQTTPERESPDVRHDDSGFEDHTEEYDASVSPEHSDTPGKIAERERDGGRDATETVPAEQAGRDSERRETTEETPAEASGRDEATREPTDGTPAERSGRDDE
ncbi:DUF502 domain-containing protein [Halosegnis marinus]|uniref:DUF502 domain-containing protein n=1 Tax=Halosegnis marinus TaxID=3034023 RepID=A0ABD5ZLC5_9EURY|nr:DUF502 domain-containing protein [Halosegnis sp. DT85]